MPLLFSPLSVRWLALVCLLLLGRQGAAEVPPPLAGYADYAAFTQQLDELAQSEFVHKESLGQTLEGRDIWLLRVGRGEVDEKPALLIVGNTDAAHLLGSELAVRMVRRLVDSDDASRALLDRVTLYVVPRPSPDATERNFAPPWFEKNGNARPTDDDRDFQQNEDPPNDLNGDGWITMLRVEDPSGDHRPHPDDPRVMIEIDRTKNEPGQYRLFSEGIDDDGDGAFNEDGPGGVAFNRNFTFNYPYFKPGAGPHQVSEIETRAVADFAFEHPNIGAVFCFSPHDNLMHPWKPNTQTESQRIKTHVLSADAKYIDHLAEKYRELHGGQDAPPSPAGAGAFNEWAYYHFGRWSFAARGWWIPKMDAALPTRKPEEQPDENNDEENEAPGAADESKDEDEQQEPGDKASEKKADEKRGTDDLNRLRWLAANDIDGFVDWTPIEHPDFPDKKVEVGGFKPFYALNPPAAELDGLAEKHLKFVQLLGESLPQLSLDPPQVEALGGGVFRVTATVCNTGYLPTFSKMGEISKLLYPPQLAIELPDGGVLVHGAPRTALDVIAGHGGTAEHTWLVRLTKASSGVAKIRVYAPALGADEQEAKLP